MWLIGNGEQRHVTCVRDITLHRGVVDRIHATTGYAVQIAEAVELEEDGTPA